MVSQGSAPKTDSAVGAELPEFGVPEAVVPDPLEEDVAVVPLLVEAGEEEPDAVLAAVGVCAQEVAPVFPAVGIETPIFPASAAVRANRVRKSTDAAVGFEAVPVAAADNPALEGELIEVR